MSVAWSARKHAAVAAASARQAFAARGDVLGRAAFYLMFLVIFSRVWRALPAGSGVADPASLLWYLAVTEWVLISIPSIHLDLERDVRDGDVATLLPRPISYLGARISEALGALFARLVTLAIVGVPAAWLLAGGLPADARGLPWALVVGPLAAAFGVVAQAAIGLLAVRLHDVTAVYLVWQKAAFVLGGLVLPLTLYPAWLRAIAEASPFAAFLYGPGRLALGYDPAATLGTVLSLLAWGTAAALIAAWLYRRALRVLDVHGG